MWKAGCFGWKKFVNQVVTKFSGDSIKNEISWHFLTMVTAWINRFHFYFRWTWPRWKSLAWFFYRPRAGRCIWRWWKNFSRWTRCHDRSRRPRGNEYVNVKKADFVSSQCWVKQNAQSVSLSPIDDSAKDGGKEFFTKMHCVLITNP